MKIIKLKQKLINRLSFRVVIPIIVLILATGFSLYYSVYKLSSDFVGSLIKEGFEEMSRDIYKTMDKNMDELLKHNLINDEKSVRIRKGITIGIIEDFIKENSLECLITEKNKVLFSTSQLPAQSEALLEQITKENTFSYAEIKGEGYYAYKFAYEPWDWKLIILKSQTKYSILIDKVRNTYILNGIALLSLMLLIILFLNKAIKKPVDKIIEDIQKEDKPKYKGIYEFEFLSTNIARMIETLKNQNQYLAALHETTIDLISRLELNDLLIAIVTRAGTIAGTPHGFIYLLEPGGSTEMKLQIGTSFFTQRIGRKIKCGEGLAGRVLQNNAPMVVDDYHIWEGKITSDNDIDAVRAMVGVPLKSGTETVGVIGLAHLEDNESLKFDDDKVEVLNRFAHLASIAFDNARLYTAAQQELTERRKAENSLREINQSTQALIQSSPVAIFALDTECKISMWNPAAEHIFGWKESEVLGNINPVAPYEELDKFHHWRERILKGESCTDEEIKCRKNDNSTFEASFSAAPLLDANDNIIGIMCLAEDISEHKKRERELEAVVTVSSALRSAQNKNEMYPIILEQLQSILKVDCAMLAMREKNDSMIIELAKGVCRHWTGKHLAETKELNNLILSGKPYLCNDIRDDNIFISYHLDCGLSGMASVPLIAQEQTIGMLWIGRKSKITEQELRLLTATGDITANAIHRATLHEQTEQRMRQLVALHSIDMAITSSMSLDITLDVLINQIITQLKVDAGDILLFDPYSFSLKFAAGRGITSKEHKAVQLQLGEDYAGIAAMGRRNIFIPDLRQTQIVHKYSKLLISEGFISYFCIPLITKGEIKGVLELFSRTEITPDQEWKDFLNALTVQTAIAVDNSNLVNELQNYNVELQMAYDSTIEAWSRILDLRDKETEGHSLRVTETTLLLARKMGMIENELVHVRRGALLHDIGKMAIPDNILLKPDTLNEKEIKIMQLHPVYAFEMLSPIKYLQPALNIPYCHHEKWDGTGYPRGLKGDQIPLESRIFAIVDVWDALKSHRTYRLGWSDNKIRKHIASLSGTHFDPKVVRIFFDIMEWQESD